MVSKKFILTATLVLCIVLTSFTSVFASTNASGIVTLKEVSTKAEGSYKVGDEIVINVSIAVKGMDGINMFLAGVLDYNKNLLEYKGVVLSSEWSLISDKNQIFIERRDLKDSTGTICKMKFKVIKEFTETSVGLKEIDASSIDSTNLLYIYGNVNSPNISIKANPVSSTTEEKTENKTPVIENKVDNTVSEKTNTVVPENNTVIENKVEDTNTVVSENKTENNTVVENKVDNTISEKTENKVENNNTVTTENTIKQNAVEKEINKEEVSKEIQQIVAEAKGEIMENVDIKLEEQKASIIETICDYIASIAQNIVNSILKIFGL